MQNSHVPISGNEISVVSADNCHLHLDDQADSGDMCLLRHLEQGGPCELEVTGGSDDLVVVNGIQFSQGDKVILRGGDEVVFGQSGKHAYIFQHPLQDNGVTKPVLVSANTGPTILASEPATSPGENNQGITESGLKQEILSPEDIKVTLDNFPYYVSRTTKEILLSAAFIHLKKEFRKCLQEISSLNQRILLSGPSGSEMYQEALIKALAKHFDARFLILDSLLLCGTTSKLFQESLKDARRDDAPTSTSGTDTVRISNNTFREGDRVEYVGHGSLNLTPRLPAYGSLGIVMLTFEKNQSSKVGVRFDNAITDGNDLGGLCEENHGFFCHDFELQPDSSGGEEVDDAALGKLIEVISEESKSSKLIVLLKNVERLFTEHKESHTSLRGELPLGVLIIGSQIQSDRDKDTLSQRRCATKSTAHLKNLFPNNICIQLPQNEAQLLNLKKQLEDDAENLKAKTNVLNIRKFLASREIECNDLQELSIKDRLLTNENVDKIVGSAVSHHLQHNKSPNDGKMILPIESLKHGFITLKNADSGTTRSKNALKDVVTENEFEQKVLSNVISPNEIGVTFEDIGALDNVKETMGELVMLPLRRPELFSKGQLRKPVKGILLFGPPGTGKTMLAKAIATEAGANFINVSMSIIASKMLGESEKYVKAVFSLASKISPAVIFVDEVDSMLSNRGSPGEHEEMRKIKNEFMVNWDGLRTKEQERVLVLGATNRPYDLDGAVVRRFPRRIMVSLPDASNREKILKVLLSKETLAPDVDLELVAKMTEGYSGSDLKNLCVTAAHCPICEMIEEEKKEKSLAIAEGKPEPPLRGRGVIRPLGMGDLKFALSQVCASLSLDSVTMNRIVQWNNEFGDGGSRKKETPPYIM
ncbi:hypothetical protein HU200_057338 [Digitaria exilis]|uniref:AAA+ ATPase domain-containing protein n=1 Tax=Digitaria exilis TaxID=1010633 RepID=A0A835E038_9POAL|nr:hypothetical protein HU200_057338 [Digitaria exilis]